MTTGPNLQLTSLIATRQVLPATRRVEPTRPTTQTATPRLSFIAHRPRSGQITPRHKKPHRETAGFLKFKWGVKVATDHVGMPSAKKKAPPTPGMLLKKTISCVLANLNLIRRSLMWVSCACDGGSEQVHQGRAAQSRTARGWQ